MPKIIPGNWTLELTPEQIEVIDWYIANPPKYYKFFYKLYKKVLNKNAGKTEEQVEGLTDPTLF